MIPIRLKRKRGRPSRVQKCVEQIILRMIEDSEEVFDNINKQILIYGGCYVHLDFDDVGKLKLSIITPEVQDV